ncbi:MAG: hypothetical protein ACXACY_30440 [Candidatus Hodarchaeales archaeon]|jgi:hypothetical protein
MVRRTDKALERKREIGQESDEVVIEYLRENPASTMYEISKALDWTAGKVQGSLIRLKDRFGDKLTVEEVVENRRVKVKYDIKE